jgi:hypothetical protein
VSASLFGALSLALFAAADDPKVYHDLPIRLMHHLIEEHPLGPPFSESTILALLMVLMEDGERPEDGKENWTPMRTSLS